MLIDATALLTDLKRLVRQLEDDIRERALADKDTLRRLKQEHAEALRVNRTATTFSSWLDDQATQSAVAWVLGTVFVRFCEDNALIGTPWLAGQGSRGQLAHDNYENFWRSNPTGNDRDWLLQAFESLRQYPAMSGLFDEHNPLHALQPSADGAAALRAFWLVRNNDDRLTYDFTSEDLDTRFLGDLYQDLSESARKKYALLQTPEFVEEFILDQTLTPAIAEHGLSGLRLIDPTCGSGHFLLGAFHRLLAEWQRTAPAIDERERVQRALDHIHGVDINPFAVAIARFRLAVAAMRAAKMTRLDQAPAFDYHVAVGDSLLAGLPRQRLMVDNSGAVDTEGGLLAHTYPAEDVDEHPDILEPGRYHVVVGNPPYITVKDKALNEAYRAAYPMCAGKYALSVPFMELFFRLAVRGMADTPAGFVGQITSNSFMKREFGKKVIEQLLSGHDVANPVDLTEVIDTSGAYIPGHGTPTVILIGRRRTPQSRTVRAVLGVRGEPGQPDDPAKGLVWTQIVDHLDEPGYDGEYITVTDLARETLAGHPWSLSGGGAGTVMGLLDSRPDALKAHTESIGFAAITGDDEAFVAGLRSPVFWKRSGIPTRIFVEGDRVRDFQINEPSIAIYPYTAAGEAVSTDAAACLWPWRTGLRRGLAFGKTREDKGLKWWEFILPNPRRLGAPRLIAFAFVATHNHFVLDRGGKVFKQSAPVIKLPEGASEEEHLGLLAVLNSSAACFWLKQVSHNKGSTVDTKGARQTTVEWENFYEFTGTKLQEFPLPDGLPVEYGRRLDDLAQRLAAALPGAVLDAGGVPSRQALDAARAEYESVRAEMVAVQEELDWHVYRLYGLIDDHFTYGGEDLPGLALGQRAFEIALARRVAEGAEETVWFERHGSTAITEIPADWPAAYRDVVQRRLDLMASDKSIRLLERPEFKRRWAARSWADMERDALKDWLLDRLDEPAVWQGADERPQVHSVSQLAARLAHDSTFLSALDLWLGRSGVDTTDALELLIRDEHVPYLAALRYKESGMRKRLDWESTWRLQRAEDCGKAVGDIPVPPKYGSGDFRKTSYWSHRGKLDVPKERFVSYPGAERGADTTLVLGWAGWDHSQQAQALAMLEQSRATQDGWQTDRLTPLLAGLAELEPWLHQWHAETDPRYGLSPAQQISGLLDAELGRLGISREDLAKWRPPAARAGWRARTKGDS